MLVPNFHSLGPAEEKNGNKRNILKILTSFYKREDGKDQITGDLSFEREEAEASVWVKVAVNFRHSAPIRLGSAVLPRDHMVADGVVHYFLQDSGHKNGRGGRGGGGEGQLALHEIARKLPSTLAFPSFFPG